MFQEHHSPAGETTSVSVNKLLRAQLVFFSLQTQEQWCTSSRLNYFLQWYFLYFLIGIWLSSCPHQNSPLPYLLPFLLSSFPPYLPSFLPIFPLFIFLSFLNNDLWPPPPLVRCHSLNLASSPNSLLKLISLSSSTSITSWWPRFKRLSQFLFPWLPHYVSLWESSLGFPKIASFPPTSTTVHALFHTTSFSSLLMLPSGDVEVGWGAGSLSCLHL